MSGSSKPKAAPTFREDVLNVLSNVLFPVVVFLVWALATTIGTAVDQNQPPERYYEEYPAAVANVIVRLHLTNVFHSVPYIGLVVLLLLSMSVCTFRRVIPKRFPKDRAVPIAHFGLHGAVAAPMQPAAAANIADAYVIHRGFRVRTQEIGGAHWIFADKQKWARYGVLVAHLGFVVISFGVFLGWLKGYRGELQVFDRQTVAVSQAGLALTLNNFAADFERLDTPSGPFYQAAKFQSDVTVAGGDNRRRATILVNHPYITDEHVYFYQASYGFGGHFMVRRNGRLVALPGADGRLMPQDALYLPGTSRVVQYGTMLGPSDPSQVPPGMPLPRVNEYALWVFHDNIPTTDKPILLPIGKSLDAGDGYRLTALAPVPWSGLTYRHDPGELWVGAGALILVTGFVMALFFVPVKLYACVSTTGATASVGLAATTTKGNTIYEDEFAKLLAGLEEALRREQVEERAPVSAYA